MKKVIPVLAFLGLAAAGYAAYRKYKEEKNPKKALNPEEWAHFSDETDVETPAEVDENAKQSYRIQARLMADGYGENDTIDLVHQVRFQSANEMFAFVKEAKQKKYHLDEAGADNTVSVRLRISADADSIYQSILDIAQLAYTNKGSYKGFTRSVTDIE